MGTNIYNGNDRIKIEMMDSERNHRIGINIIDPGLNSRVRMKMMGLL